MQSILSNTAVFFSSRIEKACDACLEIPGYSILTAMDLVLGTGGVICSILTFGKIKCLNNAAGLLEQTPNIIGTVFRSTLQIINPRAEISEELPYAKSPASTCHKACKAFYTFSKELAKKPSITYLHLRARACFLISIPLSIACRIADFALGIISALTAYLSAGIYEDLNNYATTHLPIHFILIDVSCAVRKAINPYSPH